MYDGNGNVVGLVDAVSGAVVARYGYSAFGELLVADGPLPELNHYRFATKEQDETGLTTSGTATTRRCSGAG